jgi:hypothetical protein
VIETGDVIHTPPSANPAESCAAHAPPWT